MDACGTGNTHGELNRNPLTHSTTPPGLQGASFLGGTRLFRGF